MNALKTTLLFAGVIFAGLMMWAVSKPHSPYNPFLFCILGTICGWSYVFVSFLQNQGVARKKWLIDVIAYAVWIVCLIVIFCVVHSQQSQMSWIGFESIVTPLVVGYLKRKWGLLEDGEQTEKPAAPDPTVWPPPPQREQPPASNHLR